ncbi:MAG: nuclear transport factor 2 family protein [Thermoanaerobaculum sp.]|nr:nuclear transport factor 2 family protein [Thermoanaerobaculum sp.]
MVTLLLLWVSTLQPTASPPGEAPEVLVAQALEELRKGEMLLDAGHLEPLVAYSLTVVEGCQRVAGRSAFLEPLRSRKSAGALVTRLVFQDVVVRVYGASAVATYRFVSHEKRGKATTKVEGFATDVFEKREDGAWILVHRHRVTPCQRGSGSEP